jgi:hypothetical protein
VTPIQLKYREYERARALGMYIISQGDPMGPLPGFPGHGPIAYSHESSPLLAVRHGARGLVGLRALIGNHDMHIMYMRNAARSCAQVRDQFHRAFDLPLDTERPASPEGAYYLAYDEPDNSDPAYVPWGAQLPIIQGNSSDHHKVWVPVPVAAFKGF